MIIMKMIAGAAAQRLGQLFSCFQWLRLIRTTNLHLSHYCGREQSPVTLVDNSGQWWLTLAHWWWVIKVMRLQSLMTQHGLLQPYDASHYTSWCLQHHGQDCIKSDLTNKQKLLSVDFLVTSVFRYHILATFTVWLHHIKFQLVQARNAPAENKIHHNQVRLSWHSLFKQLRPQVKSEVVFQKRSNLLFLAILRSGFWSVGASN